MTEQMQSALDSLLAQLRDMPEPERIEALNEIKQRLHEVSPFEDEPVDCVQWVPAEAVTANTYNPNRVAPPEMRLLELSILADGYTQPIVTHREDARYVVVDGFHRNRVGKESREVRRRTKGYLPVVQIRASQTDMDKRMASTIRHNRARGRHQVDAMTDIVLELSKRNWSDAKIGRELGMEPDEVLRFKQIGGLAELFAHREFSEAWEIDESALAHSNENTLLHT
jgi:ParB-like chromosome segregation protein Spo0J